MNMQKIAVLIGLIVMVGMVIYPPWQSVDADGQASAMGYSFLWKPPEVQNIAHANLLGLDINVKLKSTTADSIDYGRLLVQEAVVAVVIGGLFVLGAKSSK
ncbi:hypothetical protein KA344_11515 [bacterium]|nr:hypothetical protein [bacterium]